MKHLRKITSLINNNIKRNYSCQVNGNDFSLYQFHEPGQNYKDKNYAVTENTTRLLHEHFQRTGGQVRTRFPPEPNGLLHVGHAKAMSLNFNYAKLKNGICFLRYDDTNPTVEDDLFIKGIQEMVQWLGYEPYKITYASDYFPQLYEMAERLIERDLAYVCHQALGKDKFREERHSRWRERDPSESLAAFRDMRNGKYGEGEATLRLKMTTDHNTVDPVAYRIKHAYHHRTKNDWCVYPTYDYAHCLCDSLEDITHSFCSTEFALRRSTYYWVCNAVDVYCPVQIEYGRLNFLNTVVSKRKIGALIEAGFVKAWDDPRLYTLAALRRRGFPPESINEFCSNFGFRKESAYIDPVQLQYYVKKHLEDTAPRIMAVFHPLKVIIINYSFGDLKEFKVANVRHDESKGFHKVTFDKEIWIERTDFEEAPPQKGFRRLTKEQHVGLKYTSHVISVKEIVYKLDGVEVDHLRVECTPLKETKKPRAFIHWVAKPREAKARMYKKLFRSERPDDTERVPSGFLSDVQPNSLTVSKILVGDTSIENYSPHDRFQFERIGYFCVDSDTKGNDLVFNNIVGLRQDSGF